MLLGFTMFTGDPLDGHEYAARRARAPRLGEHRLMLAVMEQAVSDLATTQALALSRQRGRAAENARRLYYATLGWLKDDEVDHPFAFRAICEALGWRTEAVRRRISSGACAPRIATRAERVCTTLASAARDWSVEELADALGTAPRRIRDACGPLIRHNRIAYGRAPGSYRALGSDSNAP